MLMEVGASQEGICTGGPIVQEEPPKMEHTNHRCLILIIVSHIHMGIP